MATLNTALPEGWEYSAEGKDSKIGTFTNNTGSDIRVTAIRIYLGTLVGTTSAEYGSVLTGTGGTITTYVKLGSSQSADVGVTKQCPVASAGYADTSHCDPYTFQFTSGVTIPAGDSKDITVKVPATREGYSGLVMCLRRSQGAEITYSPAQVTVNYHANGGSGAPASQTGSPPITLSTTKPVKSNLTLTYNAGGGSVSPTSKQISRPFTKWNTNSAGTGISYDPGATYSGNTDIALYAQYNNSPTVGILPEPTKSLTITLDPNGGTLASKTVTRQYVLDGWYTAASGGQHVNPTTTVTSDTTIFAHWSSPTVGSLPDPTYTNAEFLGWFTSKTGGTKITSTSKVSGNATYYAHYNYRARFRCNWTNPTGTIYNPDTEDIGAIIDYTKEYMSPFVIPNLIVSPDSSYDETTGEEIIDSEFEWGGIWYGSDGKSYTNGGSYLTDAPIEFTPNKVEMKYTVTFVDGYSGKVLKTISNLTAGTTLSDSQFPPAPTREGYVFAGWFGKWTDIRSDTTITAMWGKSRVWQMTSQGWKPYSPKGVE